MQYHSDIFVAEVAVPTAAFTLPRLVRPLPSPVYFGATRGYWKIYYEEDNLATLRSMGLLVTAEIQASDREEAENKAIALGERLSELLAVHTGSPVSPPLLYRLANVGPSGGVIQQNVYYYLEDRERVRQIELKPDDLQRFLERYGHIEERVLQRLELATRWYGISVSARSPLDGYLAAWIGLESIGPTLNQIFHAEVICAVCGNTVGGPGDRKIAGIEHIVKLTAPEVLVSNSMKEVAQVRHDIAHGLKSAAELTQIAGDLLPDIQASLAIGILSVGGRSAAPRMSLTGWMPRDYEVRPDARWTLNSEVELLEHEPFFGGWIEMSREFTNERSRLNPNGGYVWGAGVRTYSEIKASPDAKEHITIEYVMFDRQGAIWTNLELEGREIPVVPWRNRPIPLSWERLGNVE